MLPVLCLFLLKPKKTTLKSEQFGIKKEGMKTSIWLCILFLPIMLVVTFIIQYVNGITFEADTLTGAISFFEAFTEEFFFRGILYIFLLSRTNKWIAYITSLASFVLMHPQNLDSIFIIGTIIQGVLTIEICKRSGNLTGAWLLHGINRFFIIAIIPFLLI
jgi:membrane protease YdiL (CAAX protease family)